MTAAQKEAHEAWLDVELKAQLVESVYDNFLAASDALAKAMQWDEEYVLRRVLPKSAGERRYTRRITKWVNGEKQVWMQLYDRIKEVRQEQQKRQALLQKLNLSADELALLGIIRQP
jgi:hypothetical protein